MGSSGQISGSSKKDINAVRLVADFASAAPFAGRQVVECTYTSGDAIGYAQIAMPVSALKDTKSPSVALKLNGPAGKIKPLSRVSIGYSESGAFVQVMAATLVLYNHIIGRGNKIEDSAVGTAFDDRYLLSKVNCFGRVILNPESGNTYFDASEELIFNRNGLQDCMDGPNGPVFAPSARYGWNVNAFGGAEDFEEPAPGGARKRARSWFVEDVAKYLVNLYASSGGAYSNNTVMYNQRLPHWVRFSPGIAGSIGRKRNVREFSLQNTPLDKALQMLARKAGPFDLVIKPGAKFYSILSFESMNPPTSSANSLYLPDAFGSSDVGELMGSDRAVHAGYITESVANYFHKVAIIGDPETVERLCSTTAHPTYGPALIEKAWSDADLAAWKKYIKDHGKTRAAFDAANKLFPSVFAAWQMKKGANPFEGTKIGAAPAADRPKFRPVLLTGEQQDQANPKDWSPRPIIVEHMPALGANDGATVTNANDDKNWAPCEKMDGLFLSPDGRTVYIPHLRDGDPASWKNAGGIGSYDSDFIKEVPVRFTAAIEHDKCLSSRNAGDPNNTASRLSGDVGQFAWVVKQDALEYVEWLRRVSFPAGIARTDVAYAKSFVDKCSGGDELFSDKDRIERHTSLRLDDVKQIEYAGAIEIKKLITSLHPGMAVSVDTAGGINMTSVVKTIRWHGIEGTTTVELQSFDRHDIYDYATPSPTYHDSAKPYDGGSSGGGSGGRKSGGGYGDYKNDGYKDKSYGDYGSSGGSSSSSASGSPGEAESNEYRRKHDSSYGDPGLRNEQAGREARRDKSATETAPKPKSEREKSRDRNYAPRDYNQSGTIKGGLTEDGPRYKTEATENAEKSAKEKDFQDNLKKYSPEAADAKRAAAKSKAQESAANDKLSGFLDGNIPRPKKKQGEPQDE